MNQIRTAISLSALAWVWWLVTADAEAQYASAVSVDDCVIRFAEEVDVPAATAGILEEVLVQQNARVIVGQPLARQNSDQLLVQKRVAQLQKKAADEKLADDLELQYAQTALLEANAELEASRSIYDDAAGAVPLAMLRKLRLAVKRAELEVDREKKQRRLAQIEIDLRFADLQLLDQQMDRLTLKAPLPGVVLEVYRHSGEWISAGDSLARVARLDSLHAHCLLSVDRLSPRLCQGQPVTVRWSEAGTVRSLRGHVTSVDPELLAGGRYRLHAEIENVLEGGRWRLLPGTDVQMTVHPGSTVVSQAERENRLPEPRQR